MSAKHWIFTQDEVIWQKNLSFFFPFRCMGKLNRPMSKFQLSQPSYSLPLSLCLFNSVVNLLYSGFSSLHHDLQSWNVPPGKKAGWLWDSHHLSFFLRQHSPALPTIHCLKMYFLCTLFSFLFFFLFLMKSPFPLTPLWQEA